MTIYKLPTAEFFNIIYDGNTKIKTDDLSSKIINKK